MIFESRQVPACIWLPVAALITCAITLFQVDIANAADPKPEAATPDPKRMQCFQKTDPLTEVENRRRGSGALALENNFLTTGGQLEIGLSRKFEEGHYFFVALVDRNDPTDRTIVNPGTITYREATNADNLVQKGALRAGQIIINATIEDGTAQAWKSAYLYVYNCAGSPVDIVKREVRVSAKWLSTIATWGAIVSAYVLAALSLNRSRLTFSPLHLISGPDGRASLSKLQVLFFSLVVFGLVTFFLLRTGRLVEISGAILTLLGIAGGGAALARIVDAKATADVASPPAPPVRPEWNDLFMTGNEFDVYRYQSFLFSLVVGVALIATGVTQLSSFEIPQTLLGVLGLSQAVYIGGKIAVKSS